jgi:hypothetical protein
MDMKQFLIHFGNEHPDLRPHLKVILDVLTGKKSEPEAQEPSPLERELPVPPSEKGVFFSTSPDALRAFNTVILPQIQAQIDAASFQDIAGMVEEMESLGKSKNMALENALIVFKPVSMSTRKFYQEVQEVFNHWMRGRIKGDGSTSESTSQGPGDGKKEYHFNFS